MKSLATYFLGTALLFACSSKNPSPLRSQVFLEAEVSHYTDIKYRPVLMDRNTVFNFVLPDSQDLKTKTLHGSVIQNCSQMLSKKGYKVKINEPNCTHCVDIKSIKSEDQLKKESTVVECFLDENAGSKNCLEGGNKVYDRSIKLDFFISGQPEVIHSIETRSEGPLDSIIKVSKEMCFAAFEDFPDAHVKKKYRVPYPM